MGGELSEGLFYCLCWTAWQVDGVVRTLYVGERGLRVGREGVWGLLFGVCMLCYVLVCLQASSPWGGWAALL